MIEARESVLSSENYTKTYRSESFMYILGAPKITAFKKMINVWKTSNVLHLRNSHFFMLNRCFVSLADT